ncbi:MAG TPA: serine/threonine-protein kinase, partial [Myxococcota bacterium]|nr:serine/threonine-protein kinase [Myxococcota bacterium]
MIAGRYVLEYRLGIGGFGAVWRARDRITDGQLAVKVMTAPSDRSQARRELAALRLALLPGVVRLFDDGVEGDEAWIAMELLDGAPFLEGCGSWDEVREDVDALLDTLGALHRMGVVHGDLKPANLMLVAGRGPVVLDFGIARGRAVEVDPDPAVRGFSRSYASPEQLRGGVATARSDLFSLGVMLFEYLSGTRVAAWRTAGPVPSLGAVVDGAPGEVVAVVDRLLAEEPEDRPADADAIREALGRHERRPSLPAGLTLDAVGLRELFHGPERLLHLP